MITNNLIYLFSGACILLSAISYLMHRHRLSMGCFSLAFFILACQQFFTYKNYFTASLFALLAIAWTIKQSNISWPKK